MLFERNEGEPLAEGLPISCLQPSTHVSDRPPQAPAIRGQLIQKERGGHIKKKRKKKEKTGKGKREEKEI